MAKPRRNVKFPHRSQFGSFDGGIYSDTNSTTPTSPVKLAALPDNDGTDDKTIKVLLSDFYYPHNHCVYFCVHASHLIYVYFPSFHSAFLTFRNSRTSPRSRTMRRKNGPS